MELVCYVSAINLTKLELCISWNISNLFIQTEAGDFEVKQNNKFNIESNVVMFSIIF